MAPQTQTVFLMDTAWAFRKEQWRTRNTFTHLLTHIHMLLVTLLHSGPVRLVQQLTHQVSACSCKSCVYFLCLLYNPLSLSLAQGFPQSWCCSQCLRRLSVVFCSLGSRVKHTLTHLPLHLDFHQYTNQPMQNISTDMWGTSLYQSYCFVFDSVCSLCMFMLDAVYIAARKFCVQPNLLCVTKPRPQWHSPGSHWTLPIWIHF